MSRVGCEPFVVENFMRAWSFVLVEDDETSDDVFSVVRDNVPLGSVHFEHSSRDCRVRQHFRRAVERKIMAKHVVQQHTSAPHVYFAPVRLQRDDLRCDKASGPSHALLQSSAHPNARALLKPSTPEIRDPHVGKTVQYDVFRFDVSMRDAGAVHERNSRQNLVHHHARLLFIELALLIHVRKQVTRQHVHHKIHTVRLFVHITDAHDIRMLVKHREDRELSPHINSRVLITAVKV
mmetsp:Transcript_11962/g.26087  ORF Transcript_11962/g.26087 Transcript_11962/m.26087 type:complete len:236 (+) Transcript_11962:97-804(+)